jgi:type IV secretory pathway component VirB8
MSNEKIKLPPVLENTDAAVDIMNKLVIPTVQKNRCMTINALLGFGIVFMSFGFAYVLPLKEVKPYIISVSSTTGEVSTKDATAQNYEPQYNEIKYYANLFFKKALTVLPGRVEESLTQARRLAKGKASRVLREQIIEGMKPVLKSVSDINYTQTYTPINVSVIPGELKTLIVRFSLTERGKDSHEKTTYYNANVRYEIIPPKTEKEIMENPIGFYVVDFAMTEDISSKGGK